MYLSVSVIDGICPGFRRLLRCRSFFCFRLSCYRNFFCFRFPLRLFINAQSEKLGSSHNKKGQPKLPLFHSRNSMKYSQTSLFRNFSTFCYMTRAHLNSVISAEESVRTTFTLATSESKALAISSTANPRECICFTFFLNYSSLPSSTPSKYRKIRPLSITR